MKGSLILLIALTACALLRGQSAAVRHWILAAAIVCAATVPFLERVVPPLAVAIPALGGTYTSEPIRTAGDRQLQTPRTREGRSVDGVRPGSSDSDSTDSRLLALIASARRGVTLQWIWVAGTTISVALLGLSFVRLRRLSARATCVVDGRWATAAREIAREYGLRRPLALLCGSHPGMLVTWGLRRPRILFPPAALHWDDARIRVVLRHELAHVARGDWFTQVLAEIVRCAYWFNPLAWLACRRLREEAERAADDAVLGRGVQPTDYAEHLFELARMTRPASAWAATPLGMARPSTLERRITAMLNPDLDREPISRGARAACGATLIAITALVASLGSAQPSTARFSGSVSDPTGAPLPETTISLTHKQSGVTHAAPTDQAGGFLFSELPAGEYALEARAPGFASVEETVTLVAGESRQRDMRMNIGSVVETMTVSAASPNERPAKTAANVSNLLDRFRGKRLQPPLKIVSAAPVYPPALQDAGVEGQVVMTARITTDGMLANFDVVKASHPDLATAALDAARQWRFEPTRLWGAAVEIPISMTFNFTRRN